MQGFGLRVLGGRRGGVVKDLCLRWFGGLRVVDVGDVEDSMGVKGRRLTVSMCLG